MANPIRQKEIDERVGKFADKFWGAFQMTENGRVKSTILLYSFCLCWVLLAVYGGCFALLNPWLDGLLSGSALPVWLISLVEALAPAAAGTAAASLVWLLPGDKRLLPAGYLWLTLLMLAHGLGKRRAGPPILRDVCAGPSSAGPKLVPFGVLSILEKKAPCRRFGTALEKAVRIYDRYRIV